MSHNIRYLVLAVLIIITLAALAFTIPAPLLYSLEKDTFPSPFHDNVEALKQQSLNSTTDISPQIQEVIDLSGPVSLNLQIHDFEQARRDLERFGHSRGSFKNLIVRLDMNESEIQEIEQNAALQQEILTTLLNTSESLESLQMMEIQYYSQDNNDMLTTVRLRGNELRKKVRGLNERYNNATNKVTAAGLKLGLNVTKTQEGQMYVGQVIQEIEQPSTSTSTYLKVDTSLIPGDDRVSLFIRPETGKFRDVIEYMGISLALDGNTTLRADGKPITLYLDDYPVSTVITDTFGFYNLKLPIDRLQTGTHNLYVRSPTTRSVNRTLTVIPMGSVTRLAVSKPDQNGFVNCTGSVMGGPPANFPVRSATIQIVWDKSHVIVTKTDSSGLFMREIQLPPGQHTVTAGFFGDGYPLNPSESEPQVIDISLIQSIEPDNKPVALLILTIGFFLLFPGAAAYYLWRMSRRDKPVPLTSEVADYFDEEEPGPPLSLSDLWEPLSDTGTPAIDPLMPGTETLTEYYTRILREQGISAAARGVYQHLAGHIARDLHIKRHKTMTAREMSRNCRGKRYCGAFARFISVYERIRYGGDISVKDQTIFETAINVTDEQIGGEKH